MRILLITTSASTFSHLNAWSEKLKDKDFKLIFETTEQSNLLERRRARTRNDTRSNVEENCLRHLLSVNRMMLKWKPAVEVVMRGVGSVELTKMCLL